MNIPNFILVEKKNREVTIDLAEYVELQKTNTHFRILLEVLFADAKLSYNEKYLNFNDDSISEILKIIAPDDYEGIYEMLIEEKENKHE